MFRHSIKLKHHILRALCAAAAVMFIVAPVSAAPIGHTSFGIAGAFSIPAGEHLGTTDSITVANGGTIIVTAADMFDLSALVHFGDLGHLQDIPSLSSFSPIAGFLTLDSGVSLDLNSLTIVSRSGPTPGFLNIAGEATLHAPGFDATEGLFTWSGTTSDNMRFTFAVAASAVAQAVPEPLSATLMLVGLIAIATSYRKTHFVRIA